MTRSGSWAFIIHNKKLLLLHRDNISTIPEPNKWGLIGGFKEDNETPLETLNREIKEETNLTIANIVEKHVGEKENIIQTVYLAYPTDQELKSMTLGDEGQELRFFSIKELADIKLVRVLQDMFDNRRERFEEILNS